MTTSTRNSQASGARALVERYRRLYLKARPNGTGGAAPHPGDLLYWLGCVGAICTLLFATTR